MAKCGEDSGPTLSVPWDRIRSPEARRHGRELFLQNCALCHGTAADGHGVRSMGLDRKPADFTSSEWTAKDAPARAYRAIQDGVAGTAMASWSALSEDERWDLVAYLVSVSAPSPEKR
jgi:high-affinity iron transporter